MKGKRKNRVWKYVAFKSGTRQRNDITKVSSRPRKRLQLSNNIFKYSASLHRVEVKTRFAYILPRL